MSDAGPPPPGTPPPPGNPPPMPPGPQSWPPAGGPQPGTAGGPYAGAGMPIEPGAGPGQVKPRRKIWPWVLGVVVVFMLLMAGCVFLVVRAATGPVDRGNDFLRHIAADDFDDAFDLVDPACFDEGELTELESFFEEFALESYDLTGTERFTGGGAATGTVELEGAGTRDVRLDLTNDDGWKICGIDITGG